MAQKTVRFKVGAVTSSLAVAALLAGPAMTWGLDVPLTSGGTTSQVTSTVQNTVTSTQQTVNTAVTNVQSTVQTTVEQAPVAVQQVVASPAPSAPAPTSAPVTRTVAAVQKKAAPAKPIRTAGHTALTRTATPAVATSVAPAAVAKATHPIRRAAKTTPLAASSPAEPAPVAPASADCGGLGLTDLLPAELDLGGLLSIACTALDALAPSSASSATSVLPSLSLQEILGVTASSASKLRGRFASPLLLPQSSDQQRLGGVFAETQQSVAAGASGAVFIQRGGVAHWTLSPSLPKTVSAADASSTTNGHGHHGAFSKRVDGTKALAWTLMVDGLILALLLVWRAARRWVVPRVA